MRYLFFLTFLIVFSSLFSQETKPAKLPKKANETKFLMNVASLVRAHDADQLMMLMEPEYKRTQHDEFLQGRTDQFLTEFFGGQIPFLEITVARLIDYKLQRGNDTDYDVTFYLEGAGKKINTTFYMRKNPGTSVLTLYGAVG